MKRPHVLNADDLRTSITHLCAALCAGPWSTILYNYVYSNAPITRVGGTLSELNLIDELYGHKEWVRRARANNESWGTISTTLSQDLMEALAYVAESGKFRMSVPEALRARKARTPERAIWTYPNQYGMEPLHVARLDTDTSRAREGFAMRNCLRFPTHRVTYADATFYSLRRGTKSLLTFHTRDAGGVECIIAVQDDKQDRSTSFWTEDRWEAMRAFCHSANIDWRVLVSKGDTTNTALAEENFVRIRGNDYISRNLHSCPNVRSQHINFAYTHRGPKTWMRTRTLFMEQPAWASLERRAVSLLPDLDIEALTEAAISVHSFSGHSVSLVCNDPIDVACQVELLNPSRGFTRGELIFFGSRTGRREASPVIVNVLKPRVSIQGEYSLGPFTGRFTDDPIA